MKTGIDPADWLQIEPGELYEYKLKDGNYSVIHSDDLQHICELARISMRRTEEKKHGQ